MEPFNKIHFSFKIILILKHQQDLGQTKKQELTYSPLIYSRAIIKIILLYTESCTVFLSGYNTIRLLYNSKSVLKKKITAEVILVEVTFHILLSINTTVFNHNFTYSFTVYQQNFHFVRSFQTEIIKCNAFMITVFGKVRCCRTVCVLRSCFCGKMFTDLSGRTHQKLLVVILGLWKCFFLQLICVF